ncbi:hypothetical protein Amet_1444 [Alkaliphilus metalliredigens QYMF]|uniref:Peptidase M15C domain-containing protein n=1 Tax=Alkaliphilus metalliredigens (strain QYMF) TaxID=293826 RepID=A6TN75_ALKMQ|nr:M15 family metallopeptidase [Alkaliphilus metalliredigens]ABR47643.1 hypothetical protein Amet_1444 [Alkaliphilus metalliredigens QYMF]
MKLILKVGKTLIVVTLLILLIKFSIDTILLENEPLISQVHDSEMTDNESTGLKDENIELENRKEEDKNEDANIDTNYIDNELNHISSTINFTPIFTNEDLPQEIISKIKGVSWRKEAPVGLEDLSYLRVTYWDFHEQEQTGELIIHRKLAEEVIEIFEELYEARFPIAKMRLIDEYDADDDLSMEDNNTYAFSFRVIEGTQRISKHGYGLAIDINPIQNPYIKGDTIVPLQGGDYVNRLDVRKGMITKGDACYHAFMSRGWTWGGEWNSLKDYHHFQKEIDL